MFLMHSDEPNGTAKLSNRWCALVWPCLWLLLWVPKWSRPRINGAFSMHRAREVNPEHVFLFACFSPQQCAQDRGSYHPDVILFVTLKKEEFLQQPFDPRHRHNLLPKYQSHTAAQSWWSAWLPGIRARWWRIRQAMSVPDTSSSPWPPLRTRQLLWLCESTQQVRAFS